MNIDRVRRADSPASVRELIYDVSVEDLAQLIYELVRVEKHYSAAEVAELEGLNPKTVRNDIKAGLFGGEYYARDGRALRVSTSGIRTWRSLFRHKVPPRH
jgi:hypothetical protein